MYSPEQGDCSLEVYEQGKKLIVSPDRLCIDALYTFAFKARPGQGWQARQLTGRIQEVKEPDGNGLWPVVVTFEKDSSETYDREYGIDSDGYKRWAEGDVEEGYFRHQIGRLDDELQHMLVGANARRDLEESHEVAPMLTG